ncbi:sugar phosphate nucleotidyltransferase [Hippea maritima]|uniref:Mannose-1-phosphate guanylyltransferase., Phosphoglucosamine mutase n=1 Tax=Hippea maritima (strain ATCC 700847 / DSM 10411 / MH2) TaxID=760142 RepID=F2LVZ5_HIPMA|nr:sugar phosphate nucleotidyltransferase [Hippea maritima]AEA33929.1 Mannose-1-phosphate guanylyltransferase., Phosphoglucosamine mutase [Hippea maritima DSM 10411]
MQKMKAVIMAGGFGTRMQPLTHSTPKPMLPIFNRPMMEYVLKKIISLGINDVVVLLYFKPEVIRNYFKDGSDWNVNIHYVLPDGDYGTAGAVRQAKEFLNEPFIVLSGDVVTDFNLSNILSFHKKKSSKITIGLTSVENPLQFGVVITDESGKIEKFVEKPTWGEVISDTINTGIYVIEPEILDYIPPKGSFDFAKDLFPLLMREGIEIMGYNLDGYWRDVGNPDSYRNVHKDIFLNRLNFEIEGRGIEQAEGELYLDGDAFISENVRIVEKAMIGDGARIEKGCLLNNVVVGKNAYIGPDCVIRNSIIWGNVKIEKGVFLDNAVVCNDVVIGKNVVAKAGVILAEGVEVGQFSVFEQDVVVWPNKKIDAASIVNNNVIWGSRYKNTLFESGMIIGKSNVEISCDVACKIGEAFGSQLPVGSKVIVGRDYDRAPRMIKRAFVGGLLATGMQVIDLRAVPPTVLRYAIASDDSIMGGVYFKRDLSDPASMEILLFNEHGLKLESSSSKAVDKAFFKEEFRRVDHTHIGRITDNELVIEENYRNYFESIESLIDSKVINESRLKVAFDLMYGISKEIVPKVLSDLRIDNIILNAHFDEIKLSNLDYYEKKSKNDVSNIVKALGLDLGILIYPHGQRRTIIDDKGRVLDRMESINVMLELMDIEASAGGRKFNVLLPTWSPDLNDGYYKHLNIKRGKYTDFTINELKQFDLISKVDGNCAFPSFSLYRDALFASLKLMELLAKHNVKLSQLGNGINHFFYKEFAIQCPQLKKGRVMKKFLEIAKSKRYSTVDGIKMWEDSINWIFVMPNPYKEQLDVCIQANDEKTGMEMFKHYCGLIKECIKSNG